MSSVPHPQPNMSPRLKSGQIVSEHTELQIIRVLAKDLEARKALQSNIEKTQAQLSEAIKVSNSCYKVLLKYLKLDKEYGAYLWTFCAPSLGVLSHSIATQNLNAARAALENLSTVSRIVLSTLGANFADGEAQLLSENISNCQKLVGVAEVEAISTTALYAPDFDTVVKSLLNRQEFEPLRSFFSIEPYTESQPIRIYRYNV